jgi:hypothetical protein
LRAPGGSFGGRLFDWSRYGRQKQPSARASVTVEGLLVVQEPKPITAPSIIIPKTLQDALIAGLENPAQFARDFLGFDPYEQQAVALRDYRDRSE